MKSKILIFGLLCTLIISCQKNSDLEAANVFEDSAGLDVTLTWTVTDGSNSIANADLDLILYQGSGANKLPTNITSMDSVNFEHFRIPSTLLDGEYTVTADFFDIDKNGNLSVLFEGSSTPKRYEIPNAAAFTTGYQGQERDLARIQKTGNSFVVIRL
jgi:hypothetical protein